MNVISKWDRYFYWNQDKSLFYKTYHMKNLLTLIQQLNLNFHINEFSDRLEAAIFTILLLYVSCAGFGFSLIRSLTCFIVWVESDVRLTKKPDAHQIKITTRGVFDWGQSTCFKFFRDIYLSIIYQYTNMPSCFSLFIIFSYLILSN